MVFANYVFDSLPQDAFVIAHGQISEALITTTSATADKRGETPLLGSLQLSFKNVPLATDRYGDKTWNSILQHYAERLPAATVLFPAAALQILQQFSRSSDGRMLVLAADKGFTREDDLTLLQGPPPLEFHAGNHCFSQAVNFDAIARYFYSLDGHALLPEKRISSLNICAFLAPRSGNDFALTTAAYRGTQNAFGPDDLFALMSWLNSHLEEISVIQALAVLRLTRWDEQLCCAFSP